MADSPEEEAALEADAKAYHADDLVKRLRDYTCDCSAANPKHLTWEAANRIQALEEALQFYAEYQPTFSQQDFRAVARAALGEKKE